MDHISYQIFKILLNNQKHKTVTDNPPIRIYVNKVEDIITRQIKAGYYLKLLTPQMMFVDECSS